MHIKYEVHTHKYTSYNALLTASKVALITIFNFIWSTTSGYSIESPK